MTKIINNPKQVKSINKKRVLDVIRREGPISRASISRKTSLSRVTISSIVSELIDEGLVIEAYVGDSMAGLGGKRPQLLTLNYEKLKYIGIDIYSDLFRIAIMDVKGDVKKIIKKRCSVEKNTPQRYLGILRDQIDEILLTPEGKDIRGIGLSVPGNVKSSEGIIINSTHMKWKNVEVLEYFKDMNIPVVMDNRAVTSLIGEIWFTNHTCHGESIFYMTIGEGVGGAIMINDTIVKGMGMSAGEIGTTIVNIKNGRGIYLEDLVSDKVIVENYLTLTRKKFPPDETIIGFAKKIIEDANNKDKVALRVVKKGAEYLGIGIVNIVNLLLPKTVIITGSITYAWNIISPVIWDTIGKYVEPPSLYESLQIKKSLFQEDATLFGGVALAASHEFENIS